MNSDLHLVVIAGGSGTRFWPKSTARKPKQLLSFGKSTEGANETLLSETLKRFDPIVPRSQQWIVTTQGLAAAVENEKLGVSVLAEPQGRNTAPCIYWAARTIAKKDPRAVMLISPADHFVAAPAKLVSIVEAAAHWARNHDELITLGIVPTRPETGYGYLAVDRGDGATSKGSPKRVQAFVEKPNLDKAKEYLKAGNYFWNSGMFLWRVDVILNAFDQHMPEMKRAWEKADGRVEIAYPEMTATSIDYGIMEKAKNVVTFPVECGWDDLGSWISLESLSDSLGIRQETNVINSGQVLAVDSSRNIVDASGRYVCLLGVDDLIIVQQGEALMIASKDRAQDIRKIVEETRKLRPDLV